MVSSKKKKKKVFEVWYGFCAYASKNELGLILNKIQVFCLYDLLNFLLFPPIKLVNLNLLSTDLKNNAIDLAGVQ